MVIDCHYHLEQELLPLGKLLTEMDACGVDKIALMARLNEPFPEPPSFLIGLLLMLFKHRALRPLGRLFAAQFTPQGAIKILGKAYRIARDPDNASVFQAVAAHPDRCLGWVFVNPRGENDPVRELARWKDLPGCVGVKAHPFWHRYAPAELIPVAEQAAKLGKPLLIHAGFGAHGDFFSLYRAVPGLKLILAHAGFPLYGDTWEAIRATKIRVDLSQTSYLDDGITRAVVAALGPERCLFGTDGPYGRADAQGRYDYGLIKRRIERLFPDRSVQGTLLGHNFSTLLAGNT